MLPEPKKAPKGQFKCFCCRKLFPMREGNWFQWKTMEVHLCLGCDRTTRNTPERDATK